MDKFNIDNNMKIYIVTGGNGFIGSHIIKWLVESGYYIINIDKNKNKIKVSNNKATIKLLDEQVITKIIDLTDIINLTEYMEKVFTDVPDSVNIKGIIHLASPVGVQNILDGTKSTSDALKINVNINDISKKYDIPVLFASSSEIFGNNERIIKDSLASIPNPYENKRGGYAAQKLASEYMFLENPRNKVIRFFNITGYGHEGNMFLSLFIRNMMQNKRTIVNKNAIRLFSDINDPFIRESILYVISNINRTLDNNIFNIGYTEELFPKETIKYSKYNLANLENLVILLQPLVNGWCHVNDLRSKSRELEDDIIFKTKFYKEEINNRLLIDNNESIEMVEFSKIPFRDYKKRIITLVGDIYDYEMTKIR
jgi:UDP-glucuronate 4-epimerase